MTGAGSLKGWVKPELALDCTFADPTRACSDGSPTNPSAAGESPTWFASEFIITACHVVAAVGVMFFLAFVGRCLARLLRQPTVIGEIILGLAVGPTILAVGGHDLITTLLPAAVFDVVRFVGHVGLVLFVTGMVHELRAAAAPVRTGAVYVIAVCATVVPLATGGGLAWYVLAGGDPLLRGTAPAASLALMLAVSLAVTAVPVLARILEDRRLTDTVVGRLSLTVAVIVDVAAWLLVALAVGLKTGGATGVLWTACLLIAGLLCMLTVRRVLSTCSATAFCARLPRLTAALIAVVGLVASGLLQAWGLTEIFGAILVGFALPAGDRAAPWRAALAATTRAGRRLVPVFFVVTGVLVFTKQFGPTPWTAIAAATTLGIVGKVAGGYLGARLGGMSHRTGLRVGVLLNTRGLTELVVLQAGFSAGILTPAMYLALVIMALVTTATTGPAYALISRRTSSPPVDHPLDMRVRGSADSGGG